MKHTVEEVVLQNGGRGLLVHVPNATVMDFDIQFRAGDRYVLDKEKIETAHLVEHMVPNANKKFPQGQLFNAEIEKNGAYLNARTGPADLAYELECADFEWQRVFDLLELTITEPLFLRREFNAEVGNVKEEFSRRVNNHNIVLFSELGQKMGDTTPVDRERIEMVDNVKLADIVEHYTRTHTTDNMRFVIGGNLTPQRRNKIIKRLEKFKLPRGERFDLIEDEIETADKPLYVRRENVDNLIYGLVYGVPRRLTDIETRALNLTNHMLTTMSNSLVLGEARKRGLTYHMGSDCGYGEKSSEWYFMGQVGEDNVAELFEILIREIRKIARGRVDEKILKAAKQFALGSFQRGFQTVGALVNRYSPRYYFDETIINYRNIPREIKAVNKEQVVSVVKAMLENQIWGLGVLSNVGREDVNELHEQLSKLW